jgi:serine/threonine protein kinase/outer membrane protein assembly factor BamB
MANLEGRDLGHYHLLRQIGRGGMGEVYLAEDGDRAADDPRRQVAIKVVRIADTTLSSDAEAIRLFREGRFLTELQHPHILPIYHDGIRDDLLYLVMPYMPDGSLANAIQAQSRLSLALPLALERVVDYVGQIAEALQYSHDRRIVHRDVKPGNVLIAVEPDGRWQLLLADFGIARNVDTTTREAQWHGTVAYMAPEQFRGEISPAADQYALAVLAFQLLSGQVPWAMQPPAVRTLNPAVPPAVEAVLLQALALRPDGRYASVSAFAEALRLAAAQPVASSGPPAGAAHTPSTTPAIAPSASTRKGASSFEAPSSQTPSGGAVRPRLRRRLLIAFVLLLALMGGSLGAEARFGYLGAGSARPPHATGQPVAQLSVYLGEVGTTTNPDGPISVYAFRAGDGRLRWRHALPCPLSAPVAADSGTIYAYTVPCKHGGSTLYALRTSDGALLWQAPLATPWVASPAGGAPIPGHGPVPVAAHGVLYLGSGNFESGTYPSPGFSAVDALSASDGHRLWHAQFAGLGGAPAPLLIGGVVCFVEPEEQVSSAIPANLVGLEVYGLSAQDGHVLWQSSAVDPSSTWSSTYFSLVTDGTVLYLEFAQSNFNSPWSQQYVVLALRGSDGHVLWQQPQLPGLGSVVVTDGKLFGVATPFDRSAPGTPFALQASTGNVLWDVDSARSSGAAITMAGGNVILGTTDGSVIALRPSDGHTLWQARVTGGAVYDLTANAVTVYVSSVGGYLDAFDALHGTRVWSARIDRAEPSPPVIGP